MPSSVPSVYFAYMKCMACLKSGVACKTIPPCTVADTTVFLNPFLGDTQWLQFCYSQALTEQLIKGLVVSGSVDSGVLGLG